MPCIEKLKNGGRLQRLPSNGRYGPTWVCLSLKHNEELAREAAVNEPIHPNTRRFS